MLFTTTIPKIQKNSMKINVFRRLHLRGAGAWAWKPPLAWASWVWPAEEGSCRHRGMAQLLIHIPYAQKLHTTLVQQLSMYTQLLLAIQKYSQLPLLLESIRVEPEFAHLL